MRYIPYYGVGFGDLPPDPPARRDAPATRPLDACVPCWLDLEVSVRAVPGEDRCADCVRRGRRAW